MTCCQSMKDKLPAYSKGSAEDWELVEAIGGPRNSKGEKKLQNLSEGIKLFMCASI